MRRSLWGEHLGNPWVSAGPRRFMIEGASFQMRIPEVRAVKATHESGASSPVGSVAQSAPPPLHQLVFRLLWKTEKTHPPGPVFVPTRQRAVPVWRPRRSPQHSLWASWTAWLPIFSARPPKAFELAPVQVLAETQRWDGSRADAWLFHPQCPSNSLRADLSPPPKALI